MKWFVMFVVAAILSVTSAQAQTFNEREASIQSYINDHSGRIATVEAALNEAYPGWNGTTSTPPPSGDRALIWSTTHETGSISSSWNFGRQTVYSSGNGKTWIQEVSFAKSGRFVLAQSATMDGSSGTRCFITGDGRNGGWQALPKELYATTWIYLPKEFPWAKTGSSGDSWLNVQQLKDRPSLSGSPVEPTVQINMASDSNGPYLYLYDSIARSWRNQNISGQGRVYLPVNRWVKLEWYTLSKASGGSSWLKQDGKLILDHKNFRTIRSDGNVTNWSVNAYGGSAIGSATLYWDDCTLETSK